jgi:hypothetical protein
VNLLAQMAGAAGPSRPRPSILGLPILAWAVIVAVFVVLLVLIPTLSTSASRRAAADAKRANAAWLKKLGAGVNTILKHAEPVEPPPLDYVRAGQPIPVPRSTAKLAEEIDALKAERAASPVPLEISPPRSATPTDAGGSTAGTSGSSASAPSVAPPAATASAPSPADLTASLLRPR